MALEEHAEKAGHEISKDNACIVATENFTPRLNLKSLIIQTTSNKQ